MRELLLPISITTDFQPYTRVRLAPPLHHISFPSLLHVVSHAVTDGQQYIQGMAGKKLKWNKIAKMCIFGNKECAGNICPLSCDMGIVHRL